MAFFAKNDRDAPCVGPPAGGCEELGRFGAALFGGKRGWRPRSWLLVLCDPSLRHRDLEPPRRRDVELLGSSLGNGRLLVRRLHGAVVLAFLPEIIDSGASVFTLLG
jgi:hypothetical protein